MIVLIKGGLWSEIRVDFFLFLIDGAGNTKGGASEIASEICVTYTGDPPFFYEVIGWVIRPPGRGVVQAIRLSISRQERFLFVVRFGEFGEI